LSPWTITGFCALYMGLTTTYQIDSDWLS